MTDRTAASETRTHDASVPAGSTAPGRVLISGGGRGLGAAVADAVEAAGGTPIVLDRDPQAALDAGRVAYAVDVSDREAVNEVVERAATEAGGLDAVVTAAGIDRPGALGEVSADDWELVVRVNLLGTASVVRAALPSLIEARGRVVTVASTLALRGAGDATAYCASKFGIIGFTQALAAELQGKVGVTQLIPGGMTTPFFEGRDPKYQPTDFSTLLDPAQVAAAVVFALTRPPGTEVRQLFVANEREGSWP